MTIETKYNIGDEVWLLFEKNTTKMTIYRIDLIGGLKIMKGVTKGFYYYLTNGNSYALREESDLYPTKEELLKSLER